MTSSFLRLECEALGADAEQVRADFEASAEALSEMDGVFDQDVEADLSRKTLTFSLGVTSSSEVRALETAITAVRTALHAAGGGTPGWEDHSRMLRQEIESDSLGHIPAERRRSAGSLCGGDGRFGLWRG